MSTPSTNDPSTSTVVLIHGLWMTPFSNADLLAWLRS